MSAGAPIDLWPASPAASSILTPGFSRAVIICCAAALLWLPGASWAGDDIKITASASAQKLPPGAVFQFYVTVEASGASSLPEPSQPDFGGLEVVGQSSSQSVSIVNFSMKISRTITYQLIAPQEGTRVIPPVSMVYKGEKYTSSPVTITVDRSAQPPPSAPARPRGGFFADPFGAAPQAHPRAAVNEEDMFVTMELDKEKLWLHEQAVATFSFWRGVDLWEKPNYQKPKFEGFWVEELLFENGQPSKPTMETRNQRRYEVTRIRYALIPLSPGKLTVDPAVITVTVDPWSGSRKLITQPLEISVSPLPADGRPAEFTGMVIANPKILLRASSQETKVNDSLALTLTIKGEGYLKSSAAPNGPKADWFEAFDPKVSDDVEKAGLRLAATRTVEYPLIIRKEGAWDAPPITVAWFDPGLGKYETKKLSAGKITAVGGAGAAIAPAPAEPMGQTMEAARYIKPDRDRLPDMGSSAPGGLWIWLILTGPIPALSFAWWFKNRRDKLSSNQAQVRRQMAVKNARRRLDEAESMDEPDKFFAGLDVAARSYLADLWDAPPPSVTREMAAERLAPVSADLAQGFDELFAAVEMARYAKPGKESMSKLAQKARDLIAAMEKATKK